MWLLWLLPQQWKQGISFDESKFSKMKRGSIFVNVARGIHVVEARFSYLPL